MVRPGQGGQGINPAVRPGQGGHGINPNPGPGPRPGPGPGPHNWPRPGPGYHPGQWHNNYINNTTIYNVQNNFYGYGGYHGYWPYTPGWWGAYPGMAWTCFGLTVGTYALCSFAAISQWFDPGPVVIMQQPIPYDYGTKIYYNGDTVYVNNQPTVTVTQYYQQASALAANGAVDVGGATTAGAVDAGGATIAGAATAGTADANASDAEWLPLGVFAIMPANDTNTSLTVQLAVNKQGILRGNQFNMATGTNEIIKGAVDQATQRVAWTAGADTTTVYETGLDNLTKDQSTLMIQYGTDASEICHLVHIKEPPPADGGTLQQNPGSTPTRRTAARTGGSTRGMLVANTAGVPLYPQRTF